MCLAEDAVQAHEHPLTYGTRLIVGHSKDTRRKAG